jgi:3',5'-cyclic AMP phosphodiesterase CpdA
MTIIVHLSDFHFGREIPEVAEALIPDVAAQNPQLVAASGDFTQRALDDQYALAREYLDRLPRPQVAIPGNHDIPLYNPLARFLTPLKGYREHISGVTEPSYVDQQIALVSIDTSRHYYWKDGTVASEQLARMKREFAKAPDSACRVVMMHHPCHVPPEFPVHNRVGNADACLAAMSQAGVELVLAGHMHDGFVRLTDPAPPHKLRQLILSQAGTAISDRRRNSLNSYNVVRIEEHAITITIRSWLGSEFGETASHTFERQR